MLQEQKSDFIPTINSFDPICSKFTELLTETF